MTDYLHNLNDPQKEAVMCTDGPVLIVAGAGAGKTKTLTYRVLHLIRQGIAPSEILAITFTNKAAREMKERVGALLGSNAHMNFPVAETDMPFMSTFHSLGAWVLRNEFETARLPKRFAILDSQDSLKIVKESIEKAGLNPKQFDPRRMRGSISREKGEGVTQEMYAREAGNEYFPRMLSGVWKEYDAILADRGLVDFDDLLLRTLLLLERDADIRKKYQGMWKYLHVDEYQDTNAVQYRLSKILADPQRNICVVGDTDQSIYSWRGADMRNIFQFEDDFKDRALVLLEENYRSTQTVLGAANAVISKNKIRKDKKLFTNNPAGEPIGIFSAANESEEAEFVVNRAQTLISQGIPADNIAVLYRMNFQSRALEEAFLSHGVPYQVLGVKFFDRKEVKDVLSYVRLAGNPKNTADMARIINVPPRGLGKTTLSKIAAGTAETLPPKMKSKVDGFFSLLEEFAKIIDSERPSKALKTIIIKSGMAEHLKNGTDDDKDRYANLMELVSVASRYDAMGPEGMNQLLADAALASDQDSLEKKQEGVKLMTVHAAKGLEFDTVFVVGMEEGLFPSERALSEAQREDVAEEERRLFYVALTRAQRKLFLSYAGTRVVFGMSQVNIPSDYLFEIPEELVTAEDGIEATIEIEK